MKAQQNPNLWSCLPTAFAIALDKPVNDVITALGRDGSEIIFAGLPEPLCRKGFHPQELIKYCLMQNLAVTRVELFPTATPGGPVTDIQIGNIHLYNTGTFDWFYSNMFNSNGVVECRTNLGFGHAMAYEGKGDHAIIHDPGKCVSFEFNNINDSEKRDRYIFALWRLESMKNDRAPTG
jgi:hypothetical protein